MTRYGRWYLSGALALCALATACAVGLRINAQETRSSEVPEGLQFRLSEGKKPADAAGDAIPAPPATRLSDTDADRILARLTALKALPGDQVDFALREASLPAPRAGRTIDTPFPPPPPDLARPDVPAGALEVRRVAPQGDVPLADRVSVTFSQPMVAVTGQEDAARTVPVAISPQPEGKWRWLGTQTLIFDAGSGKRLPMATTYTVTVPAGVKSVAGAALAAETKVTFQTPTLRLIGSWPQGSSQPRNPVLWLAFDQKIDPDAVLKTLTVRSGDKTFAVRRATDTEVAAVPELKWRRDIPKERTLAVRPVALLPGAQTFEVVVGPGTPSAEGPRRTESPQSFSFATYGPLVVTSARCTWNDNEPCRPEYPWQIEFSNPLDADAFDPAWVSISPKADGVRPMVYGSTLSLQGLRKGRTTYTVTLSPKIKDIFGQTLGTSKPLVFKVGPAVPQLTAPSRPFVVLDPGAAPRALFRTVNVRRFKVRLHAVTPSDWDAWLTWQNGGPRRGTPPGRVVWEREVATAGDPDDWTETGVSLAPALKDGLGNVIVWWEADLKRNLEDRPVSGAHWFQATKIGLSAHADATDLYAWVTDLATGKPLRDVQTELGGAAQTVRTAGDGLAHFTLTERTGKMLTVRRGKDVAFLPARFWQYQDGTWRRRGQGDSLRWFVFDDRGLYKPGETVRVKGWIRRQQGGKTGALTLPQGMSTLNWVLRDSRGNEVSKGTTPVNAWAGFDLTLALPKTMNLGQAQLSLGGFGHAFNVQEFRRPEFEVSAKSESAGPHVVGGPGAELSVSASYYAGGPLPGAQTNWTVSASPTGYTPPGRSDFTFGRWTPWWGGGGIDDGDGMVFRRGRGFGPGGPGAQNVQSFAGVTDAAGVHRLHVDFDTVRPARPYSLSAQAVIQDVNRQALASSTSVLVHPSERYVGLRGARLFVEQGKPLTVEAIVCDIDGKIDAGKEIRFHAARKEWGWFKGRWQEREVDSRDWTVRSGKEPVSTEFTPKEGGTYVVRATVLDSRERPNETELTLWVAGGKPDPQKGLEQETVTLIPDRKEYKPGESAQLLAQAPFFPAEGLLTVRHNGLVRTERIRFAKASQILKVPITEAYLPNVTVQVDLVGASVRSGADGKPIKGIPARPAFAAGAIDLNVSTASRKLTLTAVPDDAKVEPGGKTGVLVSVKDASGKPVVGGEVTVAVVDESVLALAGWSLGDPVAAFYPRVGTNTGDWHLRSHLLLEDPLQVEAQTATRGDASVMNSAVADGLMGGGAMGGRAAGRARFAAPAAAPAFEMAKSMALDFDSKKDKGRAQAGEDGAPIRVRENFDALAHFSASVKTGGDGTVHVDVKVPDNLTRYRIVAVAVDGPTRAGTAESALTARLPLMARPSAPRFLNFGDRFELPVVLQNQTDAAMTVDVAVRAANASLTDGHGRRVTVPANDRVEVRFPAAAVRPGTARFQIAAVSGSHTDAAEVSLPVWTPATTEAFATYGVIDDGAVAQAVRAPADAVAQFGGLEITTSSTALQELTDAYVYLAEYPYGCAEQIASRVLATASLKDVLTAFNAPGMPDAAATNAAMGRDLKRLEELQNDDGSFGFWIRGERPWPYLGVHVAHALARARQKDFAVPDTLWNRSMAYVKAIEQKIPSDYPESCRRMITAYALYVRHLAGDSDKDRARRLLSEASLDNLGPEVVGWMLNVLANDPASAARRTEIRSWLNNHATETAGAAHYAFSYRDAAYLVLASNRRADAIVLEALIAEEPKSDLIPKLVRGLLDGRKRGSWSGTQENAFVLLALDRYFRVFEGVTPNFVARMWLGDRFAGEGKFAGRTTDRVETKVPMRYLLDQSAVVGKGLTIAKDGPGRLYYRIGMRYAPKSLDIPAADYGFAVQRTYEAVDKASDVVRGADGVWKIKAGAKVRVRVTMVATTRRYHVALVDPLPAGFEALNPELRGTEAVASAPSLGDGFRGWWPWWHWWEHQNLRDERAEAFTPLLWEGAYEFVYVCRATTPGRFVAPPAKAEEMYAPETFGRSASDKVVVE